jgi:hypothetical protein
VSESRQQLRARERREAKEATRPGPRIPEAPETAAVKQDRVVEVEPNRIVFDDDPAEVYVSWHAEWGLRDSSVSTEDSSEDLAALVRVDPVGPALDDRPVHRPAAVDRRRRSARRRDGGRGRRRAGRLPEVVA